MAGLGNWRKANQGRVTANSHDSHPRFIQALPNRNTCEMACPLLLSRVYTSIFINQLYSGAGAETQPSS
jgi:hypothetical protein